LYGLGWQFTAQHTHTQPVPYLLEVLSVILIPRREPGDLDSAQSGGEIRRSVPANELVMGLEQAEVKLSMEPHTREPQYQPQVELRARHGLTTLGLMSNITWYEDPKRLLFVLARYKFVAKMLAGRGRVLEVGCADAFGTRIVQQSVGSVLAVDFDPVFIADVQSRQEPRWPLECQVHDILTGPVSGNFEGAYALDVIEHIAPEQTNRFLKNLTDSLAPHGVLIIGAPSLESQAHASPSSRAGHVNCMTGRQLTEACGVFFHNVFLFSMNDEVVHTGFAPMAHYLFALCATRRA